MTFAHKLILSLLLIVIAGHARAQSSSWDRQSDIDQLKMSQMALEQNQLALLRRIQNVPAPAGPEPVYVSGESEANRETRHQEVRRKMEADIAKTFASAHPSLPESWRPEIAPAALEAAFRDSDRRAKQNSDEGERLKNVEAIRTLQLRIAALEAAAARPGALKPQANPTAPSIVAAPAPKIRMLNLSFDQIALRDGRLLKNAIVRSCNDTTGTVTIVSDRKILTVDLQALPDKVAAGVRP